MPPITPLLRAASLAGCLLALALPAAGQGPAAPGAFGERPRIDGTQMLADLGALAHDSMQGRAAGTDGAEKARRFLLAAFDDAGLGAPDGERTGSFDFSSRGGQGQGVNVLGLVPGTERAGRYVVVTAHYDHLGVRGGEIYNGADDNASGTAAILALARWFRDRPARHSILFVALDAEESGLRGARAFLAAPPVPLDSVVMNVNLDMVSRSEAGELYAAGTYHYPVLEPLVAEAAAAARLTLLTGHDRPGLPPGDDWTTASDHGPFHEAGIPFLYLGVEDHPGYHRPTDDADAITPVFYVEAIETALDLLLLIDREGDRILAARGR